MNTLMQLLELNLLASSFKTDYYLSGQTNDILLDDDPILDAPIPWMDISAPGLGLPRLLLVQSKAEEEETQA